MELRFHSAGTIDVCRFQKKDLPLKEAFNEGFDFRTG